MTWHGHNIKVNATIGDPWHGPSQFVIIKKSPSASTTKVGLSVSDALGLLHIVTWECGTSFRNSQELKRIASRQRDNHGVWELGFSRVVSRGSTSVGVPDWRSHTLLGAFRGCAHIILNWVFLFLEQPGGGSGHPKKLPLAWIRPCSGFPSQPAGHSN